MNQSWGAQIRACVFDAYGTLFDVHSAVGKHRSRLGEHEDRISQLWRAKQLEYTWLRSLMGQYRDFWQVTQDALDFACATHGLNEAGLRRDLMQAYLQLDCYPEVKETLQRLKERGYRTACRMALPRCLPQPLPTRAFLTASTRLSLLTL